MSLEKFSDQSLKDLVDRVSSDVINREVQLNSIRREIREVQNEIQTQQKMRKEFNTKYFIVEEVSPLVEQSLELRQNLAENKKLCDAIAQDSSQSCQQVCEIRDLEMRLHAADKESKVQLEKMKADNKENVASIKELQESYDLKVEEQEKVNTELIQLQDELLEYRRHHSSRIKTPSSPKKHDMNAQLDKFIKRTCETACLNLHGDEGGRTKDKTNT